MPNRKSKDVNTVEHMIIPVKDRIGTAGRTSRWLHEHLDYPHKDWCLLWPFAKNENGYGLYGFKNVKVHRLMCEHVHGPAPADKPEAAHECGNGHLGCVNPNHLTWKSRSENLRDMWKHGRKPGRYKLTPEQVDEIRALKDRARPDDIAKQFNITQSTVREIHAGRIWKKERQDYRVFTEDEVRMIRSIPWRQKTAKQWAKELGCSESAICRIRCRESYGWVVQ